MTEITRYQLYEGVRLNVAHTDKFESGLLSVHLITPVDRFSAALGAALPYVLLQGSADYPDEKSIRAACATFGGDMPVGDCGRVGDMQDVNLMIYFPDNGSLSQRPAVLEAAAGVLGNVLLRPRRVGGRLYGPYVDRAKERVLKDINFIAQIDRGAVSKLIETMFPREPFGIPYGGRASALDRVSVGTLTPYHRDLIAAAQVEIFYCGSVDDSLLLPIIRGAFHSLKDRPAPKAKAAKPPKKARSATVYGERGVAVGWRLNHAENEYQYAALLVLSQYIPLIVPGCLCTAIMPKGALLATLPDGDSYFADRIRECIRSAAAGDMDNAVLEEARQKAGEIISEQISLPGRLDCLCRDLAVCNIDAQPGDLAALMTVIDEKHIMAAAASAVEDTVLIVSPADDAAEEVSI